LGSRDPRRAEMLTHANHALLDAKYHRWALVAKRLAGLSRRCVTDPRNCRFWASTLLLALRRLALLSRPPWAVSEISADSSAGGAPAQRLGL
jgi:hypothetical protein